MRLTVTVDGTAHALDVDAEMRLLWMLRNTLGLTHVQVGCRGGLCRTCVVRIDGVERCSCMTPVGRVDGCTITTRTNKL